MDESNPFSLRAAVFPRPDGLRNGKGTRVWTSGAKYEGDWRGDFIHGTGVLTKAEGGSYTGTFWKGMKHGQGVEVRRSTPIAMQITVYSNVAHCLLYMYIYIYDSQLLA